MPTVAAFPDFVVAFKTAIHELLASYFDGNSHEVSDFTIAFPQAKIVHTIQELDRPLGLTIAVINAAESGRTEEKCSNINFPRKPGVELRASILANIYMAVPIQGGDNNKNRMFIDETWAKLYAVSTIYSAFSSRNIFYPNLQAVPEPSVSRTDVAEVNGSFDCEMRIKYSRYNT